MTERTESPTPRRLREARASGDSPVSTAVAQAASLLLAVLLAGSLLKAVSARAAELIRAALENPGRLSARALPLIVLELSVPVIFVIAFASAATMLLQTGAVFASSKLVPRLDRLDPMAGLRRLFSREHFGRLLRQLTFAFVLLWIAAELLRDHLAPLAASVGQLDASLQVLLIAGKKLGYAAALLAIVVACVELVSVRSAWLRRLRMTRQEVQRELKEAEGDPELKAARRRAHREALNAVSARAIDAATIVISGAEDLLVALRYIEDEDRAPVVVFRERGALASQAWRASRAREIPIHYDELLARALRDTEIGEEIPSRLYDEVAAVLRDYQD